MGWLRQLKESYWQSPQVDLLDEKLEPLRLGDTEAPQQTPIERFVEVERDLGRMTLVTQALIEVCVRKGLLTHDEIADIVGEVDLSIPTDSRWGAAATNRPNKPMALVARGNGSAAGVGVMEDLDDGPLWGNDDEPTEIEGEASGSSDDGFDFGGGEIDQKSAIEVGGSSEGGVETIPRTAPFPKPRKKKQSSMLGFFVGIVVSGVVGLAGGYFLLLWAFGRDISADYQLAQKLPQWMVPAEFHVSSSPAPSVPSNNNFNEFRNTTANTGTPDLQIPDTTDKFGAFNEAAKQNGGKAKKKGGNSAPVMKPNPRPKPQDDLSSLEEPDLSVGEEEDVFSVKPPTGLDLGVEDDPLAKIAPALPGPEEEMPAEEEEESSIPSKTELPPAEPKTFVIQGVEPVNGQTLGDAIKEANLSSMELSDQNLEDADARKAKAAAYKKFCALAQALTYVDGDQITDQLETRIPMAEKVATMALENDATFQDVGSFAKQWISAPAEKRGTAGIFLAGTVKDIQPAGELKAAVVDFGKDQQVTVVAPASAKIGLDARVAVLGVIVEDPASKLTGYEGAPGTVIWSEHVVPVEKSASVFD